MKKFTTILLALVLSLSVIGILSTESNALNITSLNTSSTGSKISVSGSTQNGVLAGAVMIYDKNGTNLVCMETFAVGADSKYSYTLDRSFANGTYLVKVADYDGGNFEEKTVTVNSSTITPSTSTAKSPNSGERTSAVIFILGVLCLGFLIPQFSKK